MRRSTVAPPALLAAVLAAGAGLGAPRAAAQDGEDTPPEAIEFYRQAREHYESGQYTEAADDLERALVLDPDSPTLVYNLARVYELLGEPARALRHYEHYQRLLPQQQAQEQDRAAATIRRLQGAAASGDPEEEFATPQEVAPLRQLPGLVLVRENGVADGLFWGTLVGGVVALGLGATLGGLALSERDAADGWVLGEDGDLDEQQQAQQTAQSLGVAADVALGVGGVAVLGAALLYFLREHTVERAPVRAVERGEAQEGASLELTPEVTLGARGAVLGLGGRW